MKSLKQIAEELDNGFEISREDAERIVKLSRAPNYLRRAAEDALRDYENDDLSEETHEEI